MIVSLSYDSSATSSICLKGTSCVIHQNVPLSQYTTYRVGGKARWYAEPKCWQDVEALFQWVEKQQIPFVALGAGSNLLVSDNGFEGLVISTRHLRGCSIDEEKRIITVDAGYPLPKLAWKMAKKGWLGLQWAVGIPGTIGGAVVMNAGAHQCSISDILINTTVASPNGKIETIPASQLDYSYRHSRLQQESCLVLQATLALKPGMGREEVMELTSKNFRMRRETQPYDKPSCGSVFRNPKPYAAGWLIEKTGLKGYQIGGAMVSHQHANFILNMGNATARNIFDLIRYVQERVEATWSILLQPEVKFLGQF
ncbi:MAG: UDP-N-acetylmuramate dehydrogenase [Geminocystis sp.]|nr:UDP-N-acetylmuramate dehydrogenase [Geminocystis sp.]HIK37412.1 UDP-N-acetylmuramate dehydrogenase [Geminocystis sp. M7585_C2015_104]